ncbi:MAG: hypothetical protein HGB17_07255, partial [Syntrophobacteraceae bacterium]|nr:hypothetical protein [Syntrophobacteraceae bacterium]
MQQNITHCDGYSFMLVNIDCLRDSTHFNIVMDLQVSIEALLPYLAARAGMVVDRAEITERFHEDNDRTLGDLMVDRYYWGTVRRVSPEAPVPVVEVESESARLGGAANVANNIQSLGGIPVLVGMIGDDHPGTVFMDLALELG